MAKYKITDNTGRSLVVSGDSPPTQEEADKIFASVPAKQASQNFDVRNQGFLGQVASSIADPFITTGKVIGAAGAEGLRGIRTLQGKDPFFDTVDGKKVPVKNPFLTDAETQEIAQNPLGFLGGQVARSAEIASYAIPFGAKPAQIFGKTIGVPLAAQGAGRIASAAGLGALRGGITGAATGSERIVPEKRMTPEEKLDDLIANTALGATTGAIIGVIADKLTKGKVQQQALQKSAFDSIDETQKLSPSVQNQSALAKAGRDLVSKQYNVPRNAAMRLHLRDTVQQLDDYGLRNIDTVREVVPKVTGDKGVITQITREASQRATPVRLEGLIDMSKEISYDPSLPPGVDSKFTEFMKKGVLGLPSTKSTGAPSAVLSQFGDPARTFDFIQSLEAKASQLTAPRAYSVISDQNVALAKAYRLMADELKTRLFYEAGADKIAVSLVSDPKYLSKLEAVSPKLAQKASEISTLGELRSLAAPFVRAGQAIDITDAGEFLVFNNLVDAVNKGTGVLSRLTNIPLALLQTNPVRAGVGGALMNIGRAGAAAVPPQVSQTAGAVAPNFLLELLLGGRNNTSEPQLQQ